MTNEKWKMNAGKSFPRICHLGKYYPPARGGMETHVQALARGQAELGAQVLVYCVNHLPGPAVEERDGAVEVRRFRRLASIAKLDLCAGLAKAIGKAKVDLFHVHVPNPNMILAVLRAAPEAPIVVTYHSDHIRQRLSAALFRPLERWFYRRVKTIVVTSAAYLEGSSFLQTYTERTQVIPLGIDLKPFLEPSRQSLALAEKLRARHPPPLWFACGRLIYYKGLEHAIRALPQVPGTLLIVGEGPERARLEAEARRLGVEDRALFLGDQPFETVVALYHAALTFWFPSNARSEGFGMVQVEAMASGCPVINTHIPGSGVDWVSRHEETGLSVPMNEPAALAAAANRLLQEPGLRERFSAAARERARTEFDHRVMAERTLKVYREVLARG